MKIFSILFLGLALGSKIKIAVDDLLVVSPFELEERSCPALQCLRRAFQPYPVEEGATLRDEICRTIAGSTFFRSTYYILPLKPKQSGIYSKTSLIEVPTNITDHYRPREVVTNRNISYETVFPCLTWDSKAGNFVEIFISQKFNLSFLDDKSPSHPFRLVFKQDGTGILVTIAIAEKPAEVNNRPILHDGEQLSEFRTTSICHLTASKKVRLCTIILNARKYRDEITFPSYANDEEPQCERQNVTWWTCGEHYSQIWKNATVSAVECQAIKKYSRIGFNPATDYFYIIQADYLYYIARKRDSKIEVVDQCNF